MDLNISLGKPENFQVAKANISNGLVATKKIPLNPESIMLFTIVLKIFSFYLQDQVLFLQVFVLYQHKSQQ
jgi:hypothetical protein